MQIEELRKITEKVVRTQRIPINGGIELLSTCNFKCVHCYNSQEPRKIMQTEMVYNLVDQLEQMGTMHIYLTGGEVMLHPDFAEIYKYIRRKGIAVSVLTNVSLLDSKLIELFEQYTPYMIDISLYGATDQTYGVVTGQAKGFSKVLSNLIMLKEHNIEFSLKTILIRENLHELDEMLNIAKSLGKHLNIYTDIRPLNNGCKQSQEHRITEQQIIEIEERYGKWEKREKHITERSEERRNRKREGYLYFCEVGKYNFFITYAGIMHGCAKERIHGYDLKTYSVKEAFELLSRQLVEKICSETYKCRKCKFIEYCDYCPAQFELDTGNPTHPLEYVCDLAKARYKRFHN